MLPLLAWADAAQLVGIAAAFLAALWLALAIDVRWGEPPASWHPVVWMGRYLGWCGAHVRTLPPPAPAFLGGALAWCFGAGVVALVAGLLQALLLRPWLDPAAFGTGAWLAAPLACLLLALLLKPMLAWRMLRDEVLEVEAALARSLPEGRSRLARLVSRDTTALTASEVRESAIESLAENLNDSVVAPVLWFLLLGLPGAAVYRFANTADAMWGYRGPWEWAGKWAARADDLLSWLPARLTAALMRSVGGGFPSGGLRVEAVRTPSPNSGWPMAAMALALGVRLRKPGVYALNAGGRAPTAADTLRAVQICSQVVVVLAALAIPAVAVLASGAAW